VPNIPERDALEGLRRLGDIGRYRRLLQHFMAHEVDVVDRIEAALSAGDQDRARRGAHSLKALAGTMGARALASAAAELEQVLRRQRDSAPELASLRATFERLVHGLAQWQPLRDPNPEADVVDGSRAHDEPVESLLQRLQQQLAEDDTEAVETADRLAHCLHHPSSRRALRSLRKALDEYDFDRASQMLPVLTESIPEA
jgi:HPt (histidine-containing phosphotransfer) domain-containing protein